MRAEHLFETQDTNARTNEQVKNQPGKSIEHVYKKHIVGINYIFKQVNLTVVKYPNEKVSVMKLVEHRSHHHQ